MVKNKLALGFSYRSKTELQMAIREYAVDNCFEVKVKRSSPMRYVVVCKDQTCSFYASASAVKGLFVVRKLNTSHSCGLLYHHDPSKRVSATYIAGKIVGRYDMFQLCLSALFLKP